MNHVFILQATYVEVEEGLLHYDIVGVYSEYEFAEREQELHLANNIGNENIANINYQISQEYVITK